jgi:hypothetical protein|tara:strand:- start:323 stop:679 length:357 start_codon:yes stop_codon:yes gene_type:complete
MEFTVNLPFIVSISFNILFIIVVAICCWYSFRLLKKIYFITDTLDEINKQITEFLTHLETVYSLDTFYGEPTLQSLLTHAKELKGFVDNYLIQVMPDDYPPGEGITNEEVENNEQENK